MSDEKKPAAKVPDGHARFMTTRQMPANEKGFVGYEDGEVRIFAASIF